MIESFISDSSEFGFLFDFDDTWRQANKLNNTLYVVPKLCEIFIFIRLKNVLEEEIDFDDFVEKITWRIFHAQAILNYVF